MTTTRFSNRIEAGQSLARALDHYRNRNDVIVLALPRGGVPVAYEVSRSLVVPLDLMLVRKLGVPGHKEFAMGAIASGGIRILTHEVIQMNDIDEDAIAEVVAEEEQELKRRELAYRQGRSSPRLEDKTVILIDDGLATGATMRAAVMASREQHAKKVIVAVPVAPKEAAEAIAAIVDEAVFLAVPSPFLAVSRWYENFGQTSDEEVQNLLESAWRSHEVTP